VHSKRDTRGVKHLVEHRIRLLLATPLSQEKGILVLCLSALDIGR